MTLTATIENYRGIQSATIDIDGLTLISGPNAAGKTSVVQAVAAALTGRAIPVAGLRKSDAGTLVRSGAASGSVTLTSEEGSVTVKWPSCKIESDGQPPAATAYATGAAHLLDHKTGERAQVLQRYLQAEPTREQLGEALDFLSAEAVDRLWQKIDTNRTPETSGWDIAHDDAKDKGARLKGQWEHATGERQYGARKAASWVPDQWEEDLADASEESLTDTLSREREYLDGLISAQAVSEDRRAQLQEKAGQIEELHGEISHADRTVEVAERSLEANRKAYEEARAKADAGGKIRLSCAHCGEENLLQWKDDPKGRNYWLQLPPTSSDGADGQKAKSEATRLEMEVKAAETELDRARTDARRKRDRLAEAEKAKAELDELPAQENTADANEIERGRERVRRAEARLGAFKVEREARRLHQAVQDNQRIVDTLAPDGLRARTLQDAVGRFVRERVQPFIDAAGWRPVTIGDDFVPAYGDRPYGLLSESEQYRVRVAIQAAMAALDGSRLVIVDGAEVLDRKGRNGLARALLKHPTPALVAMTTEDVDRNPPPDLAAKGAGRTYWIADGIAAPFGAQKEAA